MDLAASRIAGLICGQFRGDDGGLPTIRLVESGSRGRLQSSTACFSHLGDLRDQDDRLRIQFREANRASDITSTERL